MKKLLIVAIAMVLLASNTGVVFAAPSDNPNGFWGHVYCGDGDFWVWKPDEHALPALVIPGQVGIIVSLYIFDENGVPQLVWELSPNHVFKDTSWCTWEDHGLFLGGDVRILGR
jgi:hypothetical protein